MKISSYIAMIFLLLGLIGLGVKFNFDVEDLQQEFICERIAKDKKIEELEKEIRILKTDINIIQYGYESEEGNEASKM